MFQNPNRRHVLAGLSGLAAGLVPSSASAEPPPETTTIRLAAALGGCTAPLYMAEELLHQEGFSEVRYVPTSYISSGMLADGETDFDMLDGFDYLPVMDARRPLKVLSGIHVGCFELRASDDIHGVKDLQGKRVGITAIGGAEHLLVSVVASYVGLDPVTDIAWVTNPEVSQSELFAKGEVDAFIGFPPNPSQPCARTLGHALVNMAKDPPWANYFCCMAAANADFVRSNPVATKRALRALLKATDICHNEPERAARRLAERGFSSECARMTLADVRYGLWRDYDPEDSVRFFTLRLHEAGMIKATPNEIVSQFTDWRFLNEIKRELKD